MNATLTLETLKFFPERKSILILSDHGWGKSSVVAQAAAELSVSTGKPFFLIDFRLAQCETADLIGMMRHVEEAEVIRTVYKNGVAVQEAFPAKNVTLYDTAEWFPTDPDSCGILFLDELFLASRDIQNAVMELALDYRFHFKALPKGWRVVAASNDNLDVYPGTQPSPALMDRFFKIYYKPTVNEWLALCPKWNVHASIVDYLTKFQDQLYVSPVAGVVTPTPRGWVNLSDVITYMIEKGKNPLKDPAYLIHLTKGYLGDVTAVAFTNYVKENFKVFTAEDFIDKYNAALEKELKAMEVPAVSFYNKLIVAYLKPLKKLSVKQSGNLLKYFEASPMECSAGLWHDLCKENRDLAVKFHEEDKVKKFLTSIIAHS